MPRRSNSKHLDWANGNRTHSSRKNLQESEAELADEGMDTRVEQLHSPEFCVRECCREK